MRSLIMGVENPERGIPGVVVSRLTRYLTCLQGFRRKGAGWVSSQDVADALGVTSATVRRDLARLNVSGVTNRGYEAGRLYRGLVEFLGADKTWRVVVVGAGNLGKALALHGNLSRLGFRVCGIFDTDGRKTGKHVGKLMVQSLDDLPRVIRRGRVEIGVIAVPAAAAQPVADVMIVSGIRGIFNLSFAHVIAPRGVKVIEARLVAGMLELGHAIKHSSLKSRKRRGIASC